MSKSQPAVPQQAAKQKTGVVVLRVTARGKSFRRAGFNFGESPVDIPLASLKKEQVEMLKAEKMLVVVETEVEDANGDGLPD